MSGTDYILYSLGSIGIFTSRGFLPAFLTALCMRYGNDIPLIQNIDMFQSTGQEPTWFTHNISIMILGSLAALEISGEKIPDLRPIINEFMTYAKPALAFITNLGVYTTTGTAEVGSAIQQAGISDYMMPGLSAAAVFYTSAGYNGFKSILAEADPDDSLGIQNILSWIDDLWASFGIILIIVFPFLILLISATILWIYSRLGKWAAAQEEKSRTQCPQCQVDIYKSACKCYNCGKTFSTPHTLGWLGTSTEYTTSDISSHKTSLLIAKRCPECATWLEKNKPRQDCPACSHSIFSNQAEANHFLDTMSTRLAGVLLITTLFSLLPVIGVIPGIIIYRTKLIAPFRRYTPMHKNLVIKWGLRFFFFILIAFQWVPLVGGAMLPIIAFVNYSTYRKSFIGAMAK